MHKVQKECKHFQFHRENILIILGNRTTPSYVAFSDTERLIGDAAKNQVAMNPSNTVFGITLHLIITII